MLRAQGRDLHAEFVGLLPTPPQPIWIQRWSIRRVGLLALVLLLVVFVGGLLANNVSNAVALETPLGIDSLACTDLEPLWLQAQAVPSASLVPCVRSLPAGWTLANVAVNNGRSVLTLDHDRAGNAAMVVRLTASCDPAGRWRARPRQPACDATSESSRAPASSPSPGTTSSPAAVSPAGCT